jgi:hypothetical protein
LSQDARNFGPVLVFLVAYVIGPFGVVVVKGTPQRCETLLPIQKVFGYSITRLQRRSGFEFSAHEEFLRTDLERQYGTCREPSQDRFD